MHKLCVGKEAARAMRATVIRTLFDQDHYDCAPNAVFALLTPPSIDPIFALHLSAFMLIKRTFSTNSDIDKLRLLLEQHQHAFDGPIARLKQLEDHPVFSKTIESYNTTYLKIYIPKNGSIRSAKIIGYRLGRLSVEIAANILLVHGRV